MGFWVGFVGVVRCIDLIVADAYSGLRVNGRMREMIMLSSEDHIGSPTFLEGQWALFCSMDIVGPMFPCPCKRTTFVE